MKSIEMSASTTFTVCFCFLSVNRPTKTSDLGFTFHLLRTALSLPALGGWWHYFFLDLTPYNMPSYWISYATIKYPKLPGNIGKKGNYLILSDSLSWFVWRVPVPISNSEPKHVIEDMGLNDSPVSCSKPKPRPQLMGQIFHLNQVWNNGSKGFC